jgi:replication factor C subunit 3/5
MLHSQTWNEKYRPQKLDEISSHRDIIDTIQRLTIENRLPHLLFCGPPGTGKTTTILATARLLYGESFPQMILELNASDDRGIAIVRNEIQDFSSTKRSCKGFKLVILDECDSMTKDAQFALRRIIEKYSRHTRFCLICNFAYKIIPALLSRSTKFRFVPLPADQVRDRVKLICDRENLSITDNAIAAIQKLGQGDMRRTINLLQSTQLATNGTIEEDSVYNVCGQSLPDEIEKVLSYLLNQSFYSSIKEITSLKHNKGFAMIDIVHALGAHVFKLHINSVLRIYVLQVLAEIEFRLAYISSERMQVLAMVSLFYRIRTFTHSELS